MNLKIRVDAHGADHVHFTVFANGANCGELTMRTEEFDRFVAALSMALSAKSLESFAVARAV